MPDPGMISILDALGSLPLAILEARKVLVRTHPAQQAAAESPA